MSAAAALGKFSLDWTIPLELVLFVILLSALLLGKQGIDSDGNPLHMVNAFVHDVDAVVGQWSTGDDKTNEPSLFRRKLRRLLVTHPMH